MEQDVVNIYQLNAKLQQKKNALRKELAEQGMQRREGKNEYDKYKYFSEAQYKLLFTQLFSKHGLELRSTEDDYQVFKAEGKASNGRIVRFIFELIDVETGFSEVSKISGEGLDKGDKAGYKAATGALKYYLANTFMVATGDDAESESPEGNAKVLNPKIDAPTEIITELKGLANEEKTAEILNYYGIESLDELDVITAKRLIKKLKETKSE